jgi:hypothetical protein
MGRWRPLPAPPARPALLVPHRVKQRVDAERIPVDGIGIMAPDTASPLVRFHRGDGLDARGRRLEDILEWDDHRLEAVHDYIQWLFPLDEPSRFNFAAPLVTAADRQAFQDDPRLTANLQRAFERMLAFYGLRLERSGPAPRVARGEAWAERAPEWLHPGNHNLLRLTRIMKSLILLGVPELGRALYDGLAREREITDGVTRETLGYWQDAVRGAE